MTVDIAMLSEAQRRAIVEAKTFMRHGGLCGIVGGYGYCTCGMDEAVAALDAATPSVLAESTSNDCLLVAEAGELRKALEQAQNTFEQIGLVAQGCASTHGDPGGGLEMIAGYGFDGFEITHAALSWTPAVTDLSGVGVG